MLRQNTVKSLSRKRLNRVAINLGIFKAADYESELLEEKFISSRLFSDETMLYFITLSELRDIAGNLGIDASGLHRRKIIRSILDHCKKSPLARATKTRAKNQKNRKNGSKNGADFVATYISETIAGKSHETDLDISGMRPDVSDHNSVSAYEHYSQSQSDSRLIVIDFETTGLSARGGDRVIEIGAVAIEGGIVTDRYQSLVNPGTRISGFIEDYTGITNKMLDSAPRATKVMPELKKFISKSPLLAHNASFDRNFLDAEFARIGLRREQPFVCTMRLARRLYPGAPNHKLGTLVSYAKVPECGQFHRALADAEMTGLLWLQMCGLLRSRFRIQNIDLELMQLIESMPIKAADQRLRKL